MDRGDDRCSLFSVLIAAELSVHFTEDLNALCHLTCTCHPHDLAKCRVFLGGGQGGISPPLKVALPPEMDHDQLVHSKCLQLK